MPAALNDLLQQALALPDDSKLFLAEELMASVQTLNSQDEALIEHRRAEFLAGTATLIPADEAMRQVSEELTSSKNY